MIICANLWTKNPAEKKAVNLRKQAVTTKCRGKFLCGAKSRVFEKSSGFPCLKKWRIHFKWRMKSRRSKWRNNVRRPKGKPMKSVIIKISLIFNNLWTKKSLWIKIICDNPIKNYICDNLLIKIIFVWIKKAVLWM